MQGSTAFSMVLSSSRLLSKPDLVQFSSSQKISFEHKLDNSLCPTPKISLDNLSLGDTIVVSSTISPSSISVTAS